MWNRAVSFMFYNIWQKTHIPCASQTSPEAIKCVGYEQHWVRSSNHKSISTYKPVHFLCMIGADPMIGTYIKRVQDISVLHTWSIRGPSVFQEDIWSIFIAVKLWPTFYVQFPQSNKNNPTILIEVWELIPCIHLIANPKENTLNSNINFYHTCWSAWSRSLLLGFRHTLLNLSSNFFFQ